MYGSFCTTCYKQEKTAVGDEDQYKSKALLPYLQIHHVGHFQCFIKILFTFVVVVLLDKFGGNLKDSVQIH